MENIRNILFTLFISFFAYVPYSFAKSSTATLRGTTDSTIIQLFKTTGATTVEIVNGDGGYVHLMEYSIDYLKHHPKKNVVINGECYSACTMLLSEQLTNVCFTKNAKFFFHSAWTKNYILKDDMTVGEIIQKSLDGNFKMMSNFNERTKEYLVYNNAFGSYETFVSVDYDTIEYLTHKSCR